jgi:hypothetical protein
MNPQPKFPSIKPNVPAPIKLPSPAVKPPAATPITIGRGDFPKAVLQGNTATFRVYADPGLGADGATIAKSVLAVCERDYTTIKGYFGGITPRNLPYSVVIVDLSQSTAGACGGTHPITGGAYHCGCDAVTIYCDVQRTPTLDPQFTEFLNVAEFVEVLEAAQNKGWVCSASNGEGLSRVLAGLLYPDQVPEVATAASWLDGGRPDWVNHTNPTDTNDLSNGCSVLFLNYLRYQLGHPWNMIVQSASSTLAGTYKLLTKDNQDPFPAFKALLDLAFPSAPSGLTDDNPFPIAIEEVTHRRAGAQMIRRGD